MIKQFSGCLTKEKKIEKPSTRRFRAEFMSTNCKFDSPAAEIMLNITQKMPPIIGSGIVIKSAPNFDSTPKKIIAKAAAKMTRLLPTCDFLTRVSLYIDRMLC